MPFLVGMGLQYHASAVFIIGMPALFFWSLALTNALNLLDNMDGLSAGTATVSGSLLATYAFLNGAPLVGMLSVALVFSCLGFLWYNFRLRQTARIFMGDCGSMLLGYVLSGLAVIGVCPTAGDPVGVVAIPALLLAVPIFDTSFVIVMRRKERRPISQGGKDHTSHRLVYAGFSDKAAVVALWALGLAGGSRAVLRIWGSI
jgi:UDP-GlcNAc:undecaprenyl-phosphate GlcNAc-1-phosphate transferase